MSAVRAVSFNIPEPLRMFSLPRDPKDEICTDLAIAASAQFLVTWDERHLTYLMRRDTQRAKNSVSVFLN